MKAYTIGIPIATAVFVVLIVLAIVSINRSPVGGRADEVGRMLQALRLEHDFLPYTNDDETGPVLRSETGTGLNNIMVYGVLRPDYQDAILETLRVQRREMGAGPIQVRFFYPLVVEAVEGGPAVKGYATDPAPIRTERL